MALVPLDAGAWKFRLDQFSFFSNFGWSFRDFTAMHLISWDWCWFNNFFSRKKLESCPKICRMEETSLFNKMMLSLRSSCKYYTGFPKDLGPSRVIHFTSERDFVQLLHLGHPMVVAFTIKCNLTKRLDKVMEEAAAEFYPHVKFMRVECPKYPGFCLTREKTEYPFIEIFHSPEQAANQGKVVDPNTTKYSVKVLPFNYDLSAYGFREFFKRHGIQSSDPKWEIV